MSKHSRHGQEAYVARTELLRRFPGCPLTTLYRLVAAGKVRSRPKRPGSKHKVFCVADLERYLQTPDEAGSFTDEAGNVWMRPERAAELFGWDVQKLHRMRKYGCTYWLKGREPGKPRTARFAVVIDRLTAGPRAVLDVWHFLLEDLKAVAQAEQAIARLSNDAEHCHRWPAEREVNTEYGIGAKSLRRWAASPHPVLGRPVRSRLEFRQVAGGLILQVRVSSREDLDAVTRKQPARAAPVDGDDLTLAEAARRAGVNYTSILRWSGLVKGRERGCPHLGGRKLTVKGRLTGTGGYRAAETYRWSAAEIAAVARSRGMAAGVGGEGPLQATPAPATPAASSSAEARRRGRPPSPLTAEVYRFCYDGYVNGDKLAVIRELARRRFGAVRAPKEDRHVSEFAKRHARSEGVPLTRPERR